MPFARKKPVTIEYYQLRDNDHAIWLVEEFIEGHPIDLSHPVSGQKWEDYLQLVRNQGGRIIKTLEGDHLARFDDYVIKGVNGEFYPCKPDIFAKTYDFPIDESAS